MDRKQCRFRATFPDRYSPSQSLTRSLPRQYAPQGPPYTAVGRFLIWICGNTAHAVPVTCHYFHHLGQLGSQEICTSQGCKKKRLHTRVTSRRDTVHKMHKSGGILTLSLKRVGARTLCSPGFQKQHECWKLPA